MAQEGEQEIKELREELERVTRDISQLTREIQSLEKKQPQDQQEEGALREQILSMNQTLRSLKMRHVGLTAGINAISEELTKPLSMAERAKGALRNISLGTLFSSSSSAPEDHARQRSSSALQYPSSGSARQDSSGAHSFAHNIMLQLEQEQQQQQQQQQRATKKTETRPKLHVGTREDLSPFEHGSYSRRDNVDLSLNRPQEPQKKLESSEFKPYQPNEFELKLRQEQVLRREQVLQREEEQRRQQSSQSAELMQQTNTECF